MTQTEFTRRVTDSRKKLLRTARTLLPRDDCEDAVQNAILNAWEHLPQLKNEDAFDAWLYRILINCCYQIQRSRKKEQDTLHTLSVQETAAFPHEDDMLFDALAQLPTRDRRLLLLHHRIGYTIKELSEATGTSESVLKTQLYRARKRLVLLLTLLMIALFSSMAVGAKFLDVQFFRTERISEPDPIESPLTAEGSQISYDGALLTAALSDAVWNLDELTLSFVYSLTGTEDALTVCRDNLGVDGERTDHIWIDGQILPVTEWAEGRPVHLFTADEWTLGGQMCIGSSDHLYDGKGETFYVDAYLDMLTPEIYTSLLDDGMLTLETPVLIRDYNTKETLETSTLTCRIAAPDEETWRNAYETFYN